MPDMVQVLIVANREDKIAYLRDLLKHSDSIELLGQLRSTAETLRKLEVLSPDVMLVDVTEAEEDYIPFVERTSTLYPHVSVIVLSDDTNVEEVRRYMRAGAKDYLFTSQPSDLLSQSIMAVHRRERERYNRHTVAMLSERSPRQCRVIAFLSAKGGVGKSTLAVNTAAAMALQGKRTAIVDLDLQFGDASLLFNVVPTKTIVNLVNEAGDIDPEVVERYMMPHASGVKLLPACAKPEEAEYVTVAHVRVLLQALRKEYDYVIVDTGALVNDIFFAVFESADERFMVSTLNLGVLKNNRILLDLLTELQYDVNHVKHVLNRANAKNGLKVRDVKTILNAGVYCELDNDFRFVEMSANEGVLFIQKDSRHRLSRQVYALTAKLDSESRGRVSRRNPLLKRITKTPGTGRFRQG